MENPTQSADSSDDRMKTVRNDISGHLSGDAVAILDGTTIVDCNDAMLELFGGSAEDYIGKTPWEISTVPEVDGIPMAEHSRQYIREAYDRGSSRFDWMHELEDGPALTLDVTLTRVDLPEGQRVIISVRDVSNMRAAEQELRDRIEFQNRLISVSNAFLVSEYRETDAKINEALKQVGEIYNLDRIRLWWDREDRRTMYCSHGWERDGESSSGRMVRLDRVTWSHNLLASGKPYHFGTVDELPEEAAVDRAFCIAEGVKSLFVAPIALGGSVVGTASFATVHQTRDWSKRVRSELSLLAQTLGSAWQRNEYLRQVEENETELARSQQVAHVGSFSESARPGDSLLDRPGVLHQSLQASEIFGIENGTETVEIAVSRMHPDDRDRVVNAARDSFAGKPAEPVDYRIVRPDGSQVWVEERAEVERDEQGRPVRWFGTVQDVTDRRESELQLKKQVRFQGRLAALSQAFMSATVEDLDDRINRALQFIGKSYDIDRITILRFDVGKEQVRRVQQWSRDGTSTTALPIGTLIAPWSIEKITSGETYHFEDPDDLPDEAAPDKDFYRSLGVRSSLNVPVFVADTVAGSVSFSMVENRRSWSDEVINELSIFVRVVVRAWHQIESLRNLELQEAELLRSQRVARVGSYVETATPGKTLKDDNGVFKVSEEFCQIFEVEMSSDSMSQAIAKIHPDDRHQVVEFTADVGDEVIDWLEEYRGRS